MNKGGGNDTDFQCDNVALNATFASCR